MARENFILAFRAEGTRRVRRDIDQIGRSGGSVRKTLALLRAALVVFASVQILRGFVTVADSLTLIQNRIRLVTNGMGELNAVQGALFQMSQKTRTSFEQNAIIFNRLARSTADMNLTFKDLLEITELVNMAVQISGATTQEAKNSIIQFSQGLAAGALRGEELRSVVEQFPRLAETIARAAGMSAGALAQFARNATDEQIKAALGTEKVIQAIFDDAGRLKEEFKDIDRTIAQAFVQLNNTFAVFVGQLNEATGLGRALIGVVDALRNNLDKVVVTLVALAGVVAFNLIIGQLATLNAHVAMLAVGGGAAFLTLARAAGAVLVPFTLVRTILISIGSAAALMAGRVLAALAAAKTSALLFGGVLKAVFVTAPVLAWRAVVAGSVAVMAALRSITVAFGVAMTASTVAGRVGLTALVGLAVAVKAAMLLAVAPVVAVKAALLGARSAMVALSVATFANPLFLAGAAIVGTLIGLFFLFRKEISALTEKFGGLKQIFDNVVTGAVAAVKTLINGWRKLPGAIGDVAIQAANKLVEWFSFAVNKIQELLNTILPERFEFDTTPVGPNFFENSFKGQAKALAEDFKAEFESVVAAGGGIDVLKGLGKDTFDFFKNLMSLPGFDPDLLNNMPSVVSGGGTGADGKAAKEIEKLTDALRRLEASVSPLIDARQEMADAQAVINEAQAKGIRLNLSKAEILRRVTRETVGAGNAATDYAERQELLNRALETGAINAREFNQAMREARIEALEESTTLGAGIERFFLKLQASVTDVASRIEDVFTRTFQSLTDAIVDFAQTGEFNFRQFASAVVSELLRIEVQASILSFKNLLTGGGGGGGGGGSNSLIKAGFSALAGALSGGFNAGSVGAEAAGIPELLPTSKAPAGLPRFATGGSFKVGGAFPNVSGAGSDNRLVSFLAGDGEKVNVTRPGQDSGGAVQINVINNGEPVEVESQEERRGPDGQRIIDLTVKKAIEKSVNDGSLDRTFHRNFGLRRRSQR